MFMMQWAVQPEWTPGAQRCAFLPTLRTPPLAAAVPVCRQSHSPP